MIPLRPRLVHLRAAVVLAATWIGPALTAAPHETERQYLSGHGPEDAMAWDFTVTGGRRAGESASIPVPSNWEQHGFGTYNYGQEPGPKAAEHGLYRVRFAVPTSWKDRRVRLVFEGVMTDATVKVNGRLAGPTHQGAFYRFHYDVTRLIHFGANPENLLEVDVSKVSANPDTEIAERGGDYWVFGGIFRPVWLEATPAQSIEHAAIDARADGTFTADVTLASVRDATHIEAQLAGADGQVVGAPFTTPVPAGGTGRIRLTTRVDTPHLWNAESPNLYSARLTLHRGSEILHAATVRFGFRTFEVRPGQGLFLNGQRILLKGVDRHSFRPETGRTLSRADCFEDARLIRTMNMNAVRMSHYPPDEAFLEACDELGLYVLDELSGWHHAHDTDVGQRLVRAMVERDVNHPSILFWDNGNEGGWNRELDGDFSLYDPQQRHVLHPWEVHDDVDTKHYPTYEDLVQRLRGPNLLMPTEFVHALYDGGGAAGLEDYWQALSHSPFGGGGFIWAFADEGIVRTDQGGRVDVFSTYAPDGLVGPHHEKEGSYYAVRDIWSPVQAVPPRLDEEFAGSITVANHYDFTSLDQCRFNWRLERLGGPAAEPLAPEVLAAGTATAPPIAPHASGALALLLPSTWRAADALVLTATDPHAQEIWTWSWPIDAKANSAAPPTVNSSLPVPVVTLEGGEVRLTAGELTASFDPRTGALRALMRGSSRAGLANGPRLAFARPASATAPTWLSFAGEDPSAQTKRLASPQLANVIEIELDYTPATAWAGFTLEISPDSGTWKTLFAGTRRAGDGKVFNFPPQAVAAVRLSNLLRSDGTPIAVKSIRLGYAADRFPVTSAAAATFSHGTGIDPQNGQAAAWLECVGNAGLDRVRWTLRADGALRLDYAYTLNGAFLYHGITFDSPAEKIHTLRWLGQGPYRVWQNRLRGTSYGVHETARSEFQPGDGWSYPEFQGYYAGLRWARLDTDGGSLTIENGSPGLFLRVGTPRINHQNTTVDFPGGDLSFLAAIPAIGSKFITPEKTGPASQPATAAGTYRGSLVFHFDPSAAKK